MAEEKSPGIAAVASVIFTGLGQIYNGQIGKGIMFMIIGAVFCWVDAANYWVYTIPHILDL